VKRECEGNVKARLKESGRRVKRDRKEMEERVKEARKKSG
jgi:hypothetical protein